MGEKTMIGEVPSAEARRPRGPLDYGILGPVDVRGDHGSIPLGGALQRALLADLALHANQTLSGDRLVADLWLEPPSSAPKMVQILVSRVRRALGDDPEASAIVRRPGGYELQVDPDHLDLACFERLVDTGVARMPADPDGAARDLRSALDLWRGPALADVRDAPFAASAVARLDELRHRAFESWADAGLAAGQHASLIAELRDAVAAEPLRERTRGQLMLALYRSGRQADALQLFVETRRYLVSEMGIEPSSELSTLQAAILAQDPALDLPAGQPAAVRRSPAQSADEPASSAPAVPAVVRRRRRSRASLSLAVLGVAVLATASIASIGSLRSGAAPPVALRTQVVRNSVATFDISSERVVADIPVGQDPGVLALDDGNAWVANVSDRTMSKVDRASTRVLKTFGLPGAPVSVTVGDGMVWIGNGFDGTLDRIMTSFDQLAGPMWPSGEQRGLLAVATSPDDLWVGLANDELLRIEPSSLTVKTTFPLVERAQSIATVGSRPWYLGHAGHAAREVDPANLLAPREVPFTGDGRSIVSGAGSIWVSTDVPEQLVEIDPASASVKRVVSLGVSPRAFAIDGDAAWVVADSGVLEHVDFATNEVREFDLGRPIESLALSGTQLWLTVR